MLWNQKILEVTEVLLLPHKMNGMGGQIIYEVREDFFGTHIMNWMGGQTKHDFRVFFYLAAIDYNAVGFLRMYNLLCGKLINL